MTADERGSGTGANSGPRAPQPGRDDSIEAVLARVLAPVDPPEQLYRRLENTLEQVSFAAAEEISDIELSAMRDPRNWAKPAVALAAGGAAAGALVVLGLRSRRHDDTADRADEALKALGGALRDVGREFERSAKKMIG